MLLVMFDFQHSATPAVIRWFWS